MREQELKNASPLGKDTAYVNQYDVSILYPIDRSLNWSERGIDRQSLPFTGVDIWNAYEVSWLNLKGKPVVRLAEFYIPSSSKNIIESKSFKLYLNSFNLSRFESEVDVEQLLTKDLSSVAGADVKVVLRHPDQASSIVTLQGQCLDEIDIDVTQYAPDASLLTVTDVVVEESLYSHLLKSNCPVTGQPDWATIEIQYKGKQLSHAGLLAYLISYREHGDFHEQCVENIFMDIWQNCQPEQLTVYARYLRRGGLDINPYRCSEGTAAENLRLSRQ